MEHTTQPNLWAARIIDYMRSHQYNVSTTSGEINIVYLEGLNPDFTKNSDALDGWNDLSVLIDHLPDGTPILLHSAVATSEPGKASTFSLQAKRLGGVARFPCSPDPLAQQTAWSMGYHKQARQGTMHPALVQHAKVPIMVYRDRDDNGKRTGDPIRIAHGLNQHSTFPGYTAGPVGNYSAGCLVRRWWVDHLAWIAMLKNDARYQANERFLFTTTNIAGDHFLLMVEQACGRL